MATAQHSTGAVFVYSWGDGGWEYSARLVGDDTAAGDRFHGMLISIPTLNTLLCDRFGDAIAMDSEWLVVGAPSDDHQYPDPNDPYFSEAPTRVPTSMPTGTPTVVTAAPTATSSVLPYACVWNTPPLQMIGRKNDKEWDIKSLDIETGTYKTEWTIRSETDGINWDIGNINAASLSPIDSKVLPRKTVVPVTLPTMRYIYL